MSCRGAALLRPSLPSPSHQLDSFFLSPPTSDPTCHSDRNQVTKNDTPHPDVNPRFRILAVNSQSSLCYEVQTVRSEDEQARTAVRTALGGSQYTHRHKRNLRSPQHHPERSHPTRPLTRYRFALTPANRIGSFAIIPFPSRIVTNVFAFTPSTVCFPPPGQTISIFTGAFFPGLPNPNVSGNSLCDK
jgi:hypothetical protein